MLQGWIQKIRRAETPGYRRLKSIVQALLYSSMPIPRFLAPLFLLLYRARWGVAGFLDHLISFFFRSPAFRSRCEECGARLYVNRTPYAPNHTRIFVGDDVQIFGKTAIYSAPVFDEARFTIGNRVDIGHMVTVMVAKEVEIGEDTNIANYVVIADNDNHPRNPKLRISGGGPEPDEVRPVKIGKKVWLGMSCFIGKGVTIGEGSIVAAHSVVLTDVPPYSIVLGNPARVIVKDLDKRYAEAEEQPPAAVEPAAEPAKES
jgi:acetyltransferase-like isoleucine patch superfamily enzyme